MRSGRRSLLLSAQSGSSRVALHEYTHTDTSSSAALYVPSAPPRLLPSVALIPGSREQLASADLAPLGGSAFALLMLSTNRDVYTMRLHEARHDAGSVPEPVLHPALLHRALTPSAPCMQPHVHLSAAFITDLLAEPSPPPTPLLTLPPASVDLLRDAAAMPRTLFELHRCLKSRGTC